MPKHESTIHDIATRIQAAFAPHTGVESPRIVVHRVARDLPPVE